MKRMGLISAIVFTVCSAHCQTNGAPPAGTRAASPPAFALPAPDNEVIPIGPGKRLLWYIPNRIMDFADIFRFRLRLGPGLGAGVRLTDYASFYLGSYSSIYAGLPGPRNPHYIRWPLGYECLNGVVLGGVDATDDTPYGPAYGPAEVDMGLHLGIIGFDAGIDPIEIADFLAGFFTGDIARDDYPRHRPPAIPRTSGVSRHSTTRMLGQDLKPASFGDFGERLEYLHTNVETRVNLPIRSVDQYFAPDDEHRVPTPDSRMRLGLYTEFVQGQRASFSFQPDVDLDVELPNLERRLNVFVQSGQADDLPGRTPSETERQGLTVGARQYFKERAISADAGVRASIHPKAYARIQWQPTYHAAQFIIRPQQRFFVDTNDKLGSLTTLRIDHWLGGGREYYVGSVTSAKFTTDNSETEWEQTLKLGRLREMLGERRYIGRFERRDVASGGDIAFGVFGTDGEVDTYRLTVAVRRPLFKRWIFWDLEPGIEWVQENNFETGFRVTAGIDMLFWGMSGR